jgi:hypothetical protein
MCSSYEYNFHLDRLNSGHCVQQKKSWFNEFSNLCKKFNLIKMSSLFFLLKYDFNDSGDTNLVSSIESS